jgi:hypothetical protein
MLDAALIIALLACVWLGGVLAISFLEAPLKFTVAGVSRLAALSLGQVIFRAISRVERVLFALLLVGLWQAGWPTIGWPIVLGLILVAQQVWLLPRLDRDATAILAGRAAAGGRQRHRFYVAADCLKAAALVGLTWSIVRDLGHR